MRTLSVVACFLAAGVSLTACREGEQGRPIDFEKGMYPGGEPSTPIAEESLRDLRGRLKQGQGQ